MLGKPIKPNNPRPSVSVISAGKAVGVARPTYEACAACRDPKTVVIVERIEGITMSLCANYRACNRRSGVIVDRAA